MDGEGLDKLDRDILQAIVEKFDGGPVGLDTLAVALGEEADTLQDVYEPYLIMRGFLKRTPRGRVVTRAGFRHCGVDAARGAATQLFRVAATAGLGERPALAGIIGPMDELLLHACCGPCCTVAVPAWRAEGLDADAALLQPEHPAGLRTRASPGGAASEFAAPGGCRAARATQGGGAADWLDGAAAGAAGQERCAACLGLRLREPARGCGARLHALRHHAHGEPVPASRPDPSQPARRRRRRTASSSSTPTCAPQFARSYAGEPAPGPVPPALLRLRAQQVGGLGRAERPPAAGGLTAMEAAPSSTTSCRRADRADARRSRATRRACWCSTGARRRSARIAASPSCPSLLRAGDLLVRNDTRVLPARTHFRRATGGRIEVLFLEACAANGRRRRRRDVGGAGARSSAGGRDAHVGCRRPAGRCACWSELGEGRWLRRAAWRDEPVPDAAGAPGSTPLPPYIQARLADPERYQTVFARIRARRRRRPPACTSPPAWTAAAGGRRGDRRAHAARGSGHLQAARRGALEASRLHSEAFVGARPVRVSGICGGQAAGRRVIAVGTTMVRLLETLARDRAPTRRRGAARAAPDLFVTRASSSGSWTASSPTSICRARSLLALVMAFCGVEETRGALRARGGRSATASTASATRCWSCERGERTRGGGRHGDAGRVLVHRGGASTGAPAPDGS